jgi:Tfp pilus assembly protein PilX
VTARIRTIIRRLRREDNGSVLVMALIFVTVMGLVLGGMAELASVNMRNTVGAREQREAVYTANSAVNAAIEAFRQNPNSSVCDPAAPAINRLSASDVTVTCTPTPGLTVPTSGTNVPRMAVIALTSNPTEDGFFADSSGETYIKGGMYSNTGVSMTGGANLIVEDGPLVARNGCVTGGTSTMIPPETSPDCSIGTAPYADGENPLYTAAATTAPPAVAVPACPTSGPVTMPAGTYTDASALNALFDPSGPCATRVFHFPPNPDGTVGVYYFDFSNSGLHHWLIGNKDTVVVGGTFPAGFDADNIASRPVGLRCDDQAPGVQFIFGGDSRMVVSDTLADSGAGQVTLCAQHDPTQPEIALYGLDNRHPDIAPVTGTATLTAGATSGSDFTDGDKARIINNDPASATMTVNPSSRTITLGTFNVSSVPPGAWITSAELRIRHRESATTGNFGISGTLTGTGAGATFTCGTTPSCLNRNTSLITNSVFVTDRFRTRASLEGLTFSYTVSKNGGGSTPYTGYLDGVELVVSYVTPTFRQQSGCIVNGPYTGMSSYPSKCPMITTSGSQVQFSVRGTAYAPLAPFDIKLAQASSQVFNRGMIARVLRAQITGGSGCTYASGCSPFRLPDTTSTTGPTEVVFLATIESSKRLRVLARFPSGGGAPTVVSWSTMNEL